MEPCEPGSYTSVIKNISHEALTGLMGAKNPQISKSMDIKKLFTKFALLSALTAAFSTTSCNTIFESEGDCSVHYQVKFKYDMNMKFADAFPNTVPYVTVQVYDPQTGKLVLRQTDGGEALTREGYALELEGLQPGTYDIVAWCGDGLRDGKFSVPDAVAGHSSMEDLTCTMKRKNGGLVNEDIEQLYHGKTRVEFKDTFGTHATTINLTKNTNVVRVVLQHLSGLDVNPDDFTFEIKDENGFMAHDNTVLEDEVLTYNPWSVTAGSASIDADIYGASKAQTSVSVALAEFTVGRLVTENNPVLSIYNVKEDNRQILAIPLKDYALLVKGYYNRSMSDQEYLDRQDEYNLTFFLDEHGNWVSSRIIINSWHLVLQDTELK